MIRAISYTVLFCGASAGAALALAFVHDASTGASAPQAARVAPQAIVQPQPMEESIAVSFAPMTETRQPAARVAPVLEPAPQSALSSETVLPEMAAPAPVQLRASAPQRSQSAPARQVVGMSTRADLDFSARQFDPDPNGSDVARSAPLFEPMNVVTARELVDTWTTGVYR
jgi:hypothetical protein